MIISKFILILKIELINSTNYVIPDTSLQYYRMKRISIILFLLIPISMVLADDTDSIYVKQYDKVRYFNSDSVFQKLALLGFREAIDDLHGYYEDIVNYLPVERQLQEVTKMRQAAQKYDSEILEFEADYMYAFILPVNTDGEVFYKVSKMDEIIKEAIRRNDLIMKIRGMEAIFDIYWNSSLYSKAFSQAYAIDKELENITKTQYPGKGYAYYKIGKAFYFFQDYDKALLYLRRALTPANHYFDQSDLLAKNAIGSYYNLIGNIDSAEYYFRSAYFSSENVKSKPIIDAMSLSNIGQCLINRGNPDKAIPYLRAGLTRMLMDNDYRLASDVTLGLAKCYLQKKELRKAKGLIDSTQLFIRRSGNIDLYQSLYPLMCNYYSKVGDSKAFAAFFDSTLMINKVCQDKYNSLHILKAEQDLYETEVKAKDEEMRLQEQTFRYKLICGIIILFLITTGLIITVILYHKNRKAYRALIQKNQDWARIGEITYNTYEFIDKIDVKEKADTEENNTNSEKEEQPTEESIALMKQVYELVSKDKIFKNSDLTLDLMAKQMNINRNYLSKAINQITGKNFNTYINEYRVKEAIKILSDKKSDVLSIDAIAFDVGFNNRTSFYQSFKKITGLSPSDFRNNKPIT
jgi:AraC-like DNA-binding protein